MARGVKLPRSNQGQISSSRRTPSIGTGSERERFAERQIERPSGSLGNVRTETLRAFTEDEYRKIVSVLP